MRPVDAPLYQGPEPLDGVRVDGALHIDPLRVVNPLVLVAAAPRDPDVGRSLVGVDDRARHDAGEDVPPERRTLNARHDVRADLPAALDHAEHRSLGLRGPLASRRAG